MSSRQITLPPAWLIIAGSIILYLLGTALMAPFIPDDAFISFRYAENLAHGFGLTFNPGEQPVEGYSNFLWILLCALLSNLGELPKLMPIVGIALGASCLILLGAILHKHARNWIEIAIPLLLLAISAPFILYSVSAMETPLFVALLLGLVYVADEISTAASLTAWILFAVVGVALALTRPEGLIAFPIAVAILMPYARRSHKNHALLSIAIFVLLIGVYQIWRIRYYGALLPLPFMSKGVGLGLRHAWATNLLYLFVPKERQFAPCGFYYLAIVAIVGIGLYYASAARAITEWICIVLVIAYAAVYLNFVDWMPAQRYFSLLPPLLCIPLATVIRTVGKQAIIAAAIPLVALSLFTSAEVRADARMNEISTTSSLVALGHWLQMAVPSDSVLAVSDAGAIPYYSHLRTIDINPRSLMDLTIAHQGFSTQDFFHRSPDVAVLVSFSTTEPQFYTEHAALLSDQRFADYHLIGITKYNRNGRCYWVYVRKDVTPAHLEDFPSGVG
jgi:arabinofuranosyltransferase